MASPLFENLGAIRRKFRPHVSPLHVGSVRARDNPGMRRLPARPLFAFNVVLLAAGCLAGCNPSLNWREVRIKESPLVALLPCKPEFSSRQVNLGGQTVDIHLSSCSADDASFGIAMTRLAAGSTGEQLATAQNHWRLAALANIGLSPSNNQTPPALREAPLRLAGLAAPQTLVSATGKRPGGAAVQFNGVWFQKGTHVFHAVIYADKINNDMAEPFFSGLQIQ